MSKAIPLKRIKTDAGTQQRPIDAAVLAQYVALMKDGVTFPPIDVISDGKEYYVVDGFHRLETKRTLGALSIAANVTTGTQTDAIWQSYSANRSHGLPRQKGVVKRIIESILCNPEWSKKPLTEIAKHVGVTHGYVSQIKSSLSEQQAHGVTTNTVERAETVVVTRKGKQVEQASQESEATSWEQPIGVKRTTRDEETKGKKPVDADGKVIPPHLHTTFERGAELHSYAGVLSKLKGEISSIAKDHPMAWGRFNLNGFRADITQMASALRLSAPHIVCSYCSGEDSEKCDACKGLGFLSKAQSRCVPPELRPKKK